MNAVLPSFMSPCAVLYKGQRLPGLYTLTDDYGSENEKFILLPAVFMDDAISGDLFTVFLEKEATEPSMIVPARQVNDVYARVVSILLGSSPRTSESIRMTKALFWRLIANFNGSLIQLGCASVFNGDQLNGDIGKNFDTYSFFTLNGVRLELVDKRNQLDGDRAVFGRSAINDKLQVYDLRPSLDLMERIDQLEDEVAQLKIRLRKLPKMDDDDPTDDDQIANDWGVSCD